MIPPTIITESGTHPGTAVTRVVDYEPPLVLGEPCVPLLPTALRRPTNRARHLRAVRPVAAPPSDRLRSAAAFADAALRSILEVIDRRRPAAQLRPLLAGGLADTVASCHRSTPIRDAAAVLRRVRLQPTDDRERAFEVCASYSCGPRLHAIACRIEQVPAPRGVRWQVVALHMG